MLDNIRIVLVNTHHPGNIGSAARAMKNMGLTRLYLVQPLNFPSAEATALASSATDILQSAIVVDQLADALQGCTFVCGTTARLRSVKWPQVDARECGVKIHQESEQHEVALVFGRERSGLSNDELELCQALVNIPTNEAYSSLNLSQAVQVLSYEILMASRQTHPVLSQSTGQSNGQSNAQGNGQSNGQSNVEVISATTPLHMTPAEALTELAAELDDPSINIKDTLATNEQMERMYGHFLDALTEMNFFGKRNPEHIMRKLRCLFSRARTTQREVQILRGILSHSSGRKTQTPEK